MRSSLMSAASTWRCASLQGVCCPPPFESSASLSTSSTHRYSIATGPRIHTLPYPKKGASRSELPAFLFDQLDAGRGVPVVLSSHCLSLAPTACHWFPLPATAS